MLKKPFPERDIFYFLSAKFLFAFLVFCYDKKIAAFQLSARLKQGINLFFWFQQVLSCSILGQAAPLSVSA